VLQFSLFFINKLLELSFFVAYFLLKISPLDLYLAFDIFEYL